MHQSKQGQMNGSPQQYNSQSIPRQFPNFVPYIEPGSIHNVRMPGYMPVYPVENPLNKVRRRLSQLLGVPRGFKSRVITLVTKIAIPTMTYIALFNY